MRGFVSRSFSRSVVELVGDGVALLLGQGTQVHPFGQVLANQSLGVLVRAPLPRMVRRGEVELRSARLLDPPVTVELAPVIIARTR